MKTNRLLTVFLIVMLSGSFAAADDITLSGTVRDFLAAGTPQGVYNGNAGVGHADFENLVGDDRGIVAQTLGADGAPVYASATTTLTTHGAALFNDWYHDVAGVNVSVPFSITLHDNGNGTFSYSNNAFFPVDGKGFADSLCCGHNYSFTYQIATQFVYHTGQTFTFSGDDDVWVYINNHLALDLGGPHSTETGTIHLDDLGLTPGQTFDLEVFFAERHTTSSDFAIETSIDDLHTTPAPEPSGLVLIGSGFSAILGGVRLRRSLAHR